MDTESRKRDRFMNIGVVVLATNRYFLLGLRFIHKWRKHYKGNKNITFYLFTDTEPSDYIDTSDVIHYYSTNETWVEGANSKFKNILRLQDVDEGYLYFFDADTNIQQDFTEDWFLGSVVGGQHFGDQDWMKHVKSYDRNPKSSCYIPQNTTRPQMYYYGAFFGGVKGEMMKLCKEIYRRQQKNREIQYEPPVNDESYLNREYHYAPPTKVVMCRDFPFIVSDKGSISEIRDVKTDFSKELNVIKQNYNVPFDLVSGEVKFIQND